MTFLKRREIFSTAKPTRTIVFAIVAGVAAIVSFGYIMALAILAPEQLAEATRAATDLICDGCVGITDLANNTEQLINMYMHELTAFSKS
ncbi:MAG TPA: hypothetical protein VFS97_05795 [Nitrososphaeraceae archaeon]|nr:hypothetical protein [Nitrososphaeraceae archaeon]